ncbi:trypsin-like serine protease [Streptomyces lavendulae]|uniref:trypsin-like serine protease n=1 Tax=Streptomyces lavendulae TaxID=1914 RepID=UPI00163C6705|nr:hypothetical protein Slala01_68190 [Streptomyces lavendulae subsp. lavendulae]GLX30637.1 hypothetical protein Slala02_64570 [Streptomyces lavendulae subsp. lavendulae]
MERAGTVFGAAAWLLAGILAAPAAAIDGGAPASHGQVPWEVAIQNPDGTLDCGAGILDRPHVLTAAHCVTDLLGPRSGLTDHVCTAVPDGHGTCAHDAGGPLTNNAGVLVGVVSWGVPCGQSGADVYTSVSSFKSWISRAVEQG